MKERVRFWKDREATIGFCERCSEVSTPATRAAEARQRAEAAMLRHRLGYPAHEARR